MTSIPKPASYTRRVEVVECAALMRKALAEAFKDVLFVVRKKGNNVAVVWTNGPTEFEIRRVCEPFTSASFESIDDSTSHRNGTLNGEVVRFGAEYLLPTRLYTFGWTQRVTDLVCGYFHVAQPTHFLPYSGDALHPEWDRNRDLPNVSGGKSLLDLCRDARYYLRRDITVSDGNPETPIWLINLMNDDPKPEFDTPAASPEAAAHAPGAAETASMPTPAMTAADRCAARLLAADLNVLSPIEGLTLLYELKRIAEEES